MQWVNDINQRVLYAHPIFGANMFYTITIPTSWPNGLRQLKCYTSCFSVYGAASVTFPPFLCLGSFYFIYTLIYLFIYLIIFPTSFSLQWNKIPQIPLKIESCETLFVQCHFPIKFLVKCCSENVGLAQPTVHIWIPLWFAHWIAMYAKVESPRPLFY